MTVVVYDSTDIIPICYVSILIIMLFLLSLFRGHLRLIVGVIFYIFCSYLLWVIYGFIHVILLGFIIFYFVFLFDTLAKCGYVGQRDLYKPNQ